MKKRSSVTGLILALTLLISALAGCVQKSQLSRRSHTSTASEASESSLRPWEDSSGFAVLSEVVPDVILDIRLYSTYNFVGDRITGYEQPTALLTWDAALALDKVSEELLAKGYRLKVFDAYRPQQAETSLAEWAMDAGDVRMKEIFYPDLDKSELLEKGYLDEKSGHSRGSTVDLTLFDISTGEEVDMGCAYSFFGELSAPDCDGITEEQRSNRKILKDAMTANGFIQSEKVWWHFTLKDELFPSTYFTFPVSEENIVMGAVK